MTPGTVVEIIDGPWVGSYGTVDAFTVDGLGVRLRGHPGAPSGQRVVVQTHEVRVVDLRSRSTSGSV